MVIQRLPLSVFDILRGVLLLVFEKAPEMAPNKSYKIQFCINAEHVSNLVRPAAEIRKGQSGNSKIECMLQPIDAFCQDKCQ